MTAALHPSREQSGPTSIASAPVASPEQLGREHVRSYLLHLAHERQASGNVQKHARLALKFLYRATLGREWIVEKVACSKAPKKLPVVLSQDEMARFLDALQNAKHRALLMTDPLMAADHRTKWWLNIAIAAAAAWICVLASLFTIALLERNAVAAEFDPRSLSEPNLFIALEAYKICETERSTGRAFTSATERSSYDEGTWRTASDSWNAKPEAEKEAIKRKWESDYEQLNKSTSSRLAEVFFAPHYLLI